MKTRLVLSYELLAQRFTLNPASHWVGLSFDPKSELLTAVYLAKECAGDLMPWHGMVTKGPWDQSDEGEEFFLEALSVENLLDRLERFIEPEKFIFFEVPASTGMDVICKYPDQMFLSLFPELRKTSNRDKKNAAFVLLNNMLLSRQS